MWYYMYPDTDAVADLPFFLHSIGQHELQPRIYKPDGHMYDQFFYSTKGKGILILDGQKYDVPAGNGFFVPAYVPHEYYPHGTLWDIRWMEPRGDRLPQLYKKIGLTGGVYPLRNLTGREVQMNTMREELLNDRILGNYYASAHVQEFIMEFAKQADLLSKMISATNEITDTPNSIYQKHMKLLVDYVDHHFMNPMSEKELCLLLNITPQHLSRITRTCCGMTPIEYINHVRITKARAYLESTNLNGHEIAKRCGYENNNYFWKIFKKISGMTPGEYRKRYKHMDTKKD